MEQLLRIISLTGLGIAGIFGVFLFLYAHIRSDYVLSRDAKARWENQPKPHGIWADYAVSAAAVIAGIYVGLMGFQKGVEQIDEGTYMLCIFPFAIAELITYGIELCFSEVDNAAFERRALWCLWGVGTFLVFLVVFLPILTIFRLLTLTEQTVDLNWSACLILLGVLLPSFRTLRALRSWRSANPPQDTSTNTHAQCPTG
jgi:hypothetical protein